jgi:ATP-binding protein involved in chromosome partitioning
MKGRPNESEVLEALKQVMDPELGKDIVTLGFIKNVQISGDAVSFDLELTSPACPVKETLKKQAGDAVKALPGVERVDVRLTARSKEKDPWSERSPIPGVKSIVAVASGKGGVGKSTVAVNLALALAAGGLSVGLLDADVYGPSVAMMMGVPLEERPKALGEQLIPIERHAVKMMSIAFLLQETDAPIIWRGPMVANMVRQLLRQVLWGGLDVLVVDLPPGTGDSQLTLVQTVPITGAVIVTTPQRIAALDASRGIEMFARLGVPVFGLVENMSRFVCSECGAAHDLFPRGGVEEVEKKYGIPVLARVPIMPEIGRHGDEGTPLVVAEPQSAASKAFVEAASQLRAFLNKWVGL